MDLEEVRRILETKVCRARDGNASDLADGRRSRPRNYLGGRVGGPPSGRGCPIAGSPVTVVKPAML